MLQTGVLVDKMNEVELNGLGAQLIDFRSTDETLFPVKGSFILSKSDFFPFIFVAAQCGH